MMMMHTPLDLCLCKAKRCEIGHPTTQLFEPSKQPAAGLTAHIHANPNCQQSCRLLSQKTDANTNRYFTQRQWVQ